MSKIIALTGGIGSGKSFVASIFQNLAGIPCFNSDSEAKKIMNHNNSVKSEIISILGSEAYIREKLNTHFLRHEIFNSKKKLKIINDIVHEQVKANFKKWLASQTTKYILKETAILFEHSYQLDVDFSILVTAPIDVRIDRIIKRDKIPKENIQKIIENQWDDKKKLGLCDFFIENLNKKGTFKKIKNLVEIFSTI